MTRLIRRLCMLVLPFLARTAWSQTAPAPASAVTPEMNATLITLHVKDAPASDVFADLCKQLGFPAPTFPAAAGSWPRITIDADKQPYWTVLAAIDDLLHKTVLLRPDGSLDVPNIAGPFPGVRQVSGRFLILLHTIDSGVSSPGPAQSVTGRAEIYLRPEPGLSILQITTTAKVTLAQDEKGQSLLSPEVRPPNRQSLYSDGPLAFPRPIVLWFKPLPDPGRRMARLEGTLSVWVAGKPQTLTIDNLMTARTSSHPWAGGALRINQIRRTGDRAYQIDIAAESGTAGADGTRDVRSLLYATTAQVLDDAGTPLYIAGAAPDGNGSLFVRANQVDPNTKAEAHEPAKLILTLPSEIKEIAVPFAFKDLPMP